MTWLTEPAAWSRRLMSPGSLVTTSACRPAAVEATVASVMFVVARSLARPYPEKVVSSYQMKSSWSCRLSTLCPCWPAYQVALSLGSVSQRPPTDEELSALRHLDPERRYTT